MRIKGLFWILTALLLSVLAIITYHAFYTESVSLFFLVEGLVLLTVLYLSVFYRRIIKPLHIIGNGMELLKEQDFSSRLSRVGQKEADRIVDIFNKMMEQLKNERLHLREQNHFLDLLINASPMGVIMLNLDKEVLSVNPAARKMLTNTCSKSELSRLTIGETESSSITIRIFRFRQIVSIKRLQEKTTAFSGCVLVCGSGMRTTSAKFVIKWLIL